MPGKLKAYIESLEREAIPQLSVNCVIMGYHKNRLHVVVNELSAGEKSLMLLPGGYVKQTEDLTDAVERVVQESTGLENILFKQFAVFGEVSRSFAGEVSDFAGDRSNLDPSILDWFSRRFISLCYLALVDYNTIELKPVQYFDSVTWVSLDQANSLALDHGKILLSAREFLAREMPYTPIVSNLLPPRFTLPEMQSLVESILDRKIDRGNFRRKILGAGLLEKVGLDRSGNRRPADLYRFRDGRKTSLMAEMKIGF